jgi:prevent-host-death family protein
MEPIAVKTIGASEAKTKLGQLLDDVQAGEIITITRHGVPVATLGAARSGRSAAAEAAAGLRGFRAKHGLKGTSIRELVEDGRRR